MALQSFSLQRAKQIGYIAGCDSEAPGSNI